MNYGDLSNHEFADDVDYLNNQLVYVEDAQEQSEEISALLDRYGV